MYLLMTIYSICSLDMLRFIIINLWWSHTLLNIVNTNQNTKLKGSFRLFEVGLHEVRIHSRFVTCRRFMSAQSRKQAEVAAQKLSHVLLSSKKYRIYVIFSEYFQCFILLSRVFSFSTTFSQTLNFCILIHKHTYDTRCFTPRPQSSSFGHRELTFTFMLTFIQVSVLITFKITPSSVEWYLSITAVASWTEYRPQHSMFAVLTFLMSITPKSK